MPLIKIDGHEFEAAEGPNGLKIFPPSALEPTLEGYRKRVFMLCYKDHPHYASHRRGRPKGGAVKQFEEGIDQRGNGGKR